MFYLLFSLVDLCISVIMLIEFGFVFTRHMYEFFELLLHVRKAIFTHTDTPPTNHSNYDILYHAISSDVQDDFRQFVVSIRLISELEYLCE